VQLQTLDFGVCLGFRREGPDRAGADGVREDGRVRAAHPAGAAQQPPG